MAKKAYIGVGGVARKIKKGYIGIGGVARKIKKTYIGIGGVARPCWSSDPKVEYWGRAQDLSIARSTLSATTVGNYALFGGGTGTDGNADITDGYNESLTRVSVDRLQDDNSNVKNAATTVGNYALFGGGAVITNDHEIAAYDVTAYDTALTRSYPNRLDDNACSFAATTVGNYALFGGGREYIITIENWTYKEYTDWKYNVTTYDTSLTQGTASILSQEKSALAATTVGGYALFGGGSRDGVCSITVDTYNTSLTKGTAADLSIAREELKATTVGDYALFAGGYNGYGSNVDTVDVYNSSLTKITTISSLSAARDKLAATSFGGYALFGGGSGCNYVDVYDKNLTKHATLSLSSSRSFLAATAIGNYALFGGGNDGSDSGVVDVYTIV